jgi:hypothetical protein
MIRYLRIVGEREFSAIRTKRSNLIQTLKDKSHVPGWRKQNPNCRGSTNTRPGSSRAL